MCIAHVRTGDSSCISGISRTNYESVTKRIDMFREQGTVTPEDRIFEPRTLLYKLRMRIVPEPVQNCIREQSYYR